MTNSINATIVNDPYEFTFSIATKYISTCTNIRLIYIGGIAIAKKNDDFTTGFKKISKDGKLCI
jgi:hypothetical protein